MKFLIVDDDADIANYIAATLAAEAIDSAVALDAEAAHKMFYLDDFDALMVDAILPGMSGIAFAREIRAMKPDIPILFCSGATDEFNKRLMWSQGMVCHKPLDASFPFILRRFIALSFPSLRDC